MSAVAFTAPAARALPATRLRLTVRGRRVLAAAAALPAVLALSIAMISGGSALASKDSGAPAGSFATVTVSADRARLRMPSCSGAMLVSRSSMLSCSDSVLTIFPPIYCSERIQYQSASSPSAPRANPFNRRP